MPGNRRLYEHAVRRATTYSEHKVWDKALVEYRNALAEFPEDLDILEKTADVQQRLGQTPDAAQTILNIGTILSKQGHTAEAIKVWEHVTQLDNNLIEAHKNLAFAYNSVGNTASAVHENLAMAKLYLAQGSPAEAQACIQAAAALDPSNPEVQAALGALHPPSAHPEEEGGFGADDTEVVKHGSSPLDLTRDQALSDMASTIFEDHSKTGRLGKPEADALITKAIDQQTRGEVNAAIDTYRRILDAGADMPAVNFSLGLLYQENVRVADAIEQFQRTVNYPEYRLGSLFALGELYRAKGQVDEALNYFLEALKIVDLQTVSRDQADDLIQVYESLAETYAAKGEAQQSGAFVNTLVEFLSGKGWADKAKEARNRLNSLTEEGAPAISLAEILSVHGSDAVLQSLSLMHELAKRGKYYSALEEAYIAIQHAPDYLPLHSRLAEIMWKNSQTEAAIVKFIAIANTMAARGDTRPAMAVYQRVLQLAPMDVNLRTKLIEMLVSYGQIDRALEQYLALADTYYQLANLEKAREKYLEALQLAPRGSTKRLWRSQIMHKIGELDMERGDWRRALQSYEQIKKIDPTDEKARLALVELYYKVQPQRAVQEIDELIKVYKAEGKIKRLVPFLDEQIRMHPKDIGLRARAAQVSIESGLRNEGINHLNALGELQLNAGLTQQAIATIRAIIALNPPNVQAYQKLLTQIGG